MWYENFKQPTASELQEKARRSAAQAAKRGEKNEPVTVTGKSRQICTTWWGQAWCANLERYADYSNRIDRGKRYVRNGTVLDLKIKQGKIQAKVQGSRSTPYKVVIEIDPLKEKQKQALMEVCGRQIGSLEDLMQGKFPEQLKSVFMEKGALFPEPSQIHMKCSCPDWAVMCKHVAAVMYGIGVRLDENPFYFFELRGMDADSLIRKTVENKVEAMLAHANDKSPRILQTANVDELFGINDFEDKVLATFEETPQDDQMALDSNKNKEADTLPDASKNSSYPAESTEDSADLQRTDEAAAGFDEIPEDWPDDEWSLEDDANSFAA